MAPEDRYRKFTIGANGTESQVIIDDYLRDMHTYRQGFSSTSAACAGSLTNRRSSRFDIVNVRHSWNSEVSSDEVRQAMYKYAANLDSEGRTSLTPDEALTHLRYWEHTIHRRRFSSAEAMETLVNTHFLVAVAMTLLSGQDSQEADPFCSQKKAFCYLLTQFESLLRVKDLGHHNRKGLESAAAFGCHLMAKYAKDADIVIKASEILHGIMHVLSEIGSGANLLLRDGALGRSATGC